MTSKKFIEKICAAMSRATGNTFICICSEHPRFDREHFSKEDIRRSNKLLELINLFADEIKEA